MSVYRKWFCSCTGKLFELTLEQPLEDEEQGEPSCRHCGATPSSDPKKTITFEDREDWDD